MNHFPTCATEEELFYLLAHAEYDLQVLGVGEQSVRVDGDVVVEERHHI